MMVCNHGFDGNILVCPFGCHGDKDISQVHKQHKRTVRIRSVKMPVSISKPYDMSIIGQVFGKLTVLEYIDLEPKPISKRKVRCRCECGNICVRLVSFDVKNSVPQCAKCTAKKAAITISNNYRANRKVVVDSFKK